MDTAKKPLRLWPGVIAAVLLCVVRFVVPIVFPDASMFAVLGGLVGALVVVLWWVFFSRAAWSERLGAIGLMIVALLATSRVVHVSIATGMMGMMLGLRGRALCYGTCSRLGHPGPALRTGLPPTYHILVARQPEPSFARYPGFGLHPHCSQ